MHRLNQLFILSSISVLLVTIERFSFTTQVLLQPYDFMRLHEIVQMVVIILLTVIVPSIVIKEVTDGFRTVKSYKDWALVLLYVVGVYYYATGNGVHELASFYFNHYCNEQLVENTLCSSFFFNDYYTGNILYFLGGAFMILSTLLLEKDRPNKSFQKKDIWVLYINAGIYALAIFAYAAFDAVAVGIIYTLIMTVISVGVFFLVRKKYLQYPLITYTTLTYTVGTIAAAIVRFLR